VANVMGGLLIGWGMAIAPSCVSGLLYKFGAGMAGAALGILGWIAGELAVRNVTLPGPTVLPGGDDATIPGLLGLPRLLVAVIVLAVVGGALWRWRGGGDDERPGASRELPLAGAGPEPRPPWQWNWPTLGIGLGVERGGGSLVAATSVSGR